MDYKDYALFIVYQGVTLVVSKNNTKIPDHFIYSDKSKMILMWQHIIQSLIEEISSYLPYKATSPQANYRQTLKNLN